MKIIACDVESGGIAEGTSLLTAFFQILEFNNTLLAVDSLDLKIKHDIYNVEAEGMGVNKIDLIKHDKEAEYKNTAGQKLFNLLKHHSQDGADKLIPLGHGIGEDLKKIWEQLLGRKTWEQLCSYRKLDTSMNAQLFKMVGLLPEEAS